MLTSNRIKWAIVLLFSLPLRGISQTYNPSTCCTVSNKPYGAAQAVTTDGRSWFYDATNFVFRDYNGTTEVLSYLNLPKYRSGHFPIFVHSGGILQGNGVWLGGTTLVYWFKDSTGNANLVRWYTDSTGLPGGPFFAIANSLSEGNPGLIKGNLSLDLVDNTSDAQKNAASVSLTNHTIDGNDNTLLHIPNSALTNSTVGLTINSNTASDISVTTTPAALGSSLVVNIPTAGTSSRGALSATNWNFFNGKLDSVHISNDSVYNCVNGTCTLQSVIVGAGAVNSVNGTNTSLLFSPTTGNVLGQVNPNYSFTWTGQHTFSSFAPIFSTLTTNGGLFYGNASGQLLQTGAGTSGQILQSNGAAAPTYFTPNAATVNGWLGYTALSNALASTHLFVGNGSNVATDVALSGDASLLNTGALTVTGLKGKALPSLAPGVLQYDGASWLLNSAGVVAADNGLTDNSGTVELGGTMTKNTVLDDSLLTYYIHFKTAPAPGGAYNLGPFPHVILGETTTIPTAKNTNYVNDTHDNLNSPLVVSRNVAIPDFNNVPLATFTSGDGLDINGWVFKNFTSVAGKYEPWLYTYDNQDSAIQQHGYRHTAYMKHGRMTGSVSSAFVWAYDNIDSLSLSNKTGQQVLHMNVLAFETGSYHPLVLDSAWHMRVGDTGSVGNVTANGQLELVNDQTQWGLINKNTIGKNVLLGKLTVGGIFPATDTSYTLVVAGSAKVNNDLYAGHPKGLNGTPTTGSLGTNVTSLTATGTDSYMKLVLVTSGAVTGTLGVVTYSTTWTNTPIAVMSDNATTALAVVGSVGGYATFEATSATQGTLSGLITAAGTYTFYVHTGGN